jgi:hypothetical protein
MEAQVKIMGTISYNWHFDGPMFHAAINAIRKQVWFSP